MNNMLNLNLKLCFVKRNFAWFTSCPLVYQWGDDWDMAPYEFNAGMPHTCHKTKETEQQDHTVIKVYWEAAYVTPDILEEKSSWSTKTINRGDIPWLSVCPLSDQELAPIYSGTTLCDFIKLIQVSGGEVFIPFCEKLEIKAIETPTLNLTVKSKKEKSKSKSKSKKKKSK